MHFQNVYNACFFFLPFGSCDKCVEQIPDKFNFPPVSAFREKVARSSETGMILPHRIKVTGKFTYLGEDIHPSTKMSQESDSSISCAPRY